jgi:hypothetical protein
MIAGGEVINKVVEGYGIALQKAFFRARLLGLKPLENLADLVGIAAGGVGEFGTWAAFLGSQLPDAAPVLEVVVAVNVPFVVEVADCGPTG